jgi:parallel beta-helix repeat protein
MIRKFGVLALLCMCLFLLLNQTRDLHAQTPTCSQSLQSLINNAAIGSTVLVPNCVYRESVTITKPLTLDGGGKAEIRGSDIWTNWTKSGSTWIKGPVPVFDNNSDHCATDVGGFSDSRRAGMCDNQEQVFFDGKELNQVSSSPVAGEFMVNSSRQIVLAQDPTGHTVEVTTRTSWVKGGAANVTVRGFTMKHSANKAQLGALTNSGFGNWKIENNNLSYAHGVIVYISDSGGTIINNDISYAGQMGIGGNRTTGIIIKGNNVHHNNTQRFSCGFECGGMKLARAANPIVEDNQFYSNYGDGIWCDIDCSGTTIRRNRVYNNEQKGIVQEISGSGKISDNVVWGNGLIYQVYGWGAGILVQNSNNMEVFNNIVAWNADGAGIIGQASRTAPYDSAYSNSFHDNTIAQSANNSFSLFLLGDGIGNGNTSNNNKIYISGSASTEWTTGTTAISKAALDPILRSACVPLTSGGAVPCTTPSNTPTPSPSPIVTATITPFPVSGLRIDTGSSVAYTDTKGSQWLSDRGFIGGTSFDRPTIDITNTTDDRLYQTERYGMDGYSFAIPNGNYTVNLHFAETFTLVTGAGQRVFTVNAEGVSLPNIDIYKETGGRNLALIKSIEVTVTDSKLDLSFVQTGAESAVIDGLEILAKVPTGSPSLTLAPSSTNTLTITAKPTATLTPSPTPIPVPGDANGDRKVDGIDFSVWLFNYGKTIQTGSNGGDFNGDGKVDGIDFSIWLTNYQP